MNIKSINLAKNVPIIKFAEDGKDCVFPNKDLKPQPVPDSSFEATVSALVSALIDFYPELGADDDRSWGIQNIKYSWNEENSEYGFSIKMVGTKVPGTKLTITLDESSPDQVNDRIYGAMTKLIDECCKFIDSVNGSAQINLLAVKDEEIEEVEAA